MHIRQQMHMPLWVFMHRFHRYRPYWYDWNIISLFRFVIIWLIPRHTIRVDMWLIPTVIERLFGFRFKRSAGVRPSFRHYRLRVGRRWLDLRPLRHALSAWFVARAYRKFDLLPLDDGCSMKSAGSSYRGARCREAALRAVSRRSCSSLRRCAWRVSEPRRSRSCTSLTSSMGFRSPAATRRNFSTSLMRERCDRVTAHTLRPASFMTREASTS